MRYTFKAENEDFEYPEDAVITVEFSSDNLSDVLTRFGYFLKGAGLELDGEVEIVNNDEQWSEDLEEYDNDDSWDRTIITGSAAMPSDTYSASSDNNNEFTVSFGDEK